MSSSYRHPDFEKIHSAFLMHYSKDPNLGESRYADWIKFSGLDETQSYYLQGASRATKSKQSFEWANFLLQFVKEDKDAFYYKVETLFPVESMNKDCPPFTREEVLLKNPQPRLKKEVTSSRHMPYGITADYVKYVEAADSEKLAKLIKTVALLLQTKVYLFWKKMDSKTTLG